MDNFVGEIVKEGKQKTGKKVYLRMNGFEGYIRQTEDINDCEDHEYKIEKYPKNNCKHCYGRGWAGRCVKTSKGVRSNYLIPCRCVGRERL